MDKNDEARKKALKLLEHMDRTKWELSDKLKKRGFSDEEVEDAIAYVESFHYIDDLRYATRFVELHYEDRSMTKLRHDLKKRHVDEEYIELAIEAVGGDESKALEREVEKYLRGVNEISYDKKQKVIAKIYRKGYKLDNIYKAVDRMVEKINEGVE